MQTDADIIVYNLKLILFCFCMVKNCFQSFCFSAEHLNRNSIDIDQNEPNESNPLTFLNEETSDAGGKPVAWVSDVGIAMATPPGMLFFYIYVIFVCRCVFVVETVIRLVQ